MKQEDALIKSIDYVDEKLFDLRVGKKAASVAKWRFDDVIKEVEPIRDYLLSLQSQPLKEDEGEKKLFDFVKNNEAKMIEFDAKLTQLKAEQSIS